jgi:endonuclease III
MSDRNSRRAVRWIDELIPEIVEIDFSNTSVAVGENLYRVASRLGVVDPHFDSYQGKDSMGDLKIQSFAKAAFPQNPMKIAEPMNWVGMEEKDGGHCFSTQPRCPACIFETFCPRFHLHFDPAAKGMQA